MAIIEEASRRSGKNDTLTCKFRPMIGTIKTASILAKNEGELIVERRHIDDALSKHCKSIALQVMEKHIEDQIIYSVMVDPNEEPKIGQIHGLAVSTINREGSDLVGMVLTVRASCLQKNGAKKAGYFTVTGVQTKDSSYIQHSIAKIRHIIIQLYGVDVEQDCFTHVDFAQEHGVEGPSAGITMTLALISVLTQRKIHQDVAVTGEINIGDTNNKIIVTPIGGTHEKILAAQRLGFKKVCIPMRNYEKSINPSNYRIKVIGCKTIDDYIKECFINEKKQNTKN
jgi:lon-related putative ATP-dependent protease